MKLTIYLDKITVKHFEYLDSLGYTVILKGWGPITYGTIRLHI